MANVYDFTVKAQDGSEVSLADYKGKTLLIVNTATGCGFTPQYEPLQAIYDEFKDKDFEILDFPCNQFLEQAPGTDEEIHTFCTGRFGITFPQFSKIEVIGENAEPLFKWLCDNTTFGGFSGPMSLLLKGAVKKVDKDYKNNNNVKWNFTKFLVDKNGEIVARFEPTDNMDKVKEKIASVL